MAGTGRAAELTDLARARKERNRQELLSAAERVFTEQGYLAPSVDDIAKAAGVTRQTFYRHFDSKLAIALEYYDLRRSQSLAIWGSLTDAEAHDPGQVKAWLLRLVGHHKAQKDFVRVAVELGTAEPRFLAQLELLVPEIIAALAAHIPAFAAAQGEGREHRRPRAEAWLIIDQIIGRCTSAAMNFSTVDEEIAAEVIAAHLVDFVRRHEGAAAST
jgi:AcrR family transcriptional regulator